MPGERWANKVTDVRNWFEFTASEIDINNPLNEIKAHSGTASKSGGETFKITYTILASAIADELGLVGNQVRQTLCDLLRLMKYLITWELNGVNMC